ncbi:MAG: hypothetical protein JO305_05600 [Alphaproteobacteria bacterium]|nr:hypothetical protein [Alphaproteobacteria bacterium]
MISPIGAEGSDVREHADDVFDFIIQPAMGELGIRAYRSDHILSAGKITEQMFGSLLSDDMCIAILTFDNPNVFYELAVAQSAARPTVILIEKGKSMPFDLRDIRAIEYDFKPRAIRDRVYVRQLIEHVRSIEQSGWRAEVPFGRSLTPLGLKAENLSIYSDISSFGGEERWLDLLSGARDYFYTAGISMQRWAGRRFRNLLLEKARSGCDVRIMLVHQQNTSLVGMINETDRIGSLSEVASTIERVHATMSQLAQECEHLQVKLIRHGMLHQQFVLTERLAIARLYFYSRATSEAPILLLEKPSPVAEVLEREFETFWRCS